MEETTMTDSSQQATETSLSEMTAMVEKLYELKAEAKAFEAQAKEKNAEFKDLEYKVLQLLEATGASSYECPSGKIVKTRRVSVRQPKSPEDKEAFFDYLKEQGDFDGLISVNSRTLTSYVQKEIEAKEEDGKFGWVPPGLEAPEAIEYLALRKK
jgi:Fe-S oxidoreductase